jgi:hypothetical protein
VFGLPKTHTISLGDANTAPGYLEFCMWALSFFLGIRLTTTEAGFLDATAITRRGICGKHSRLRTRSGRHIKENRLERSGLALLFMHSSFHRAALAAGGADNGPSGLALTTTRITTVRLSSTPMGTTSRQSAICRLKRPSRNTARLQEFAREEARWRTRFGWA